MKFSEKLTNMEACSEAINWVGKKGFKKSWDTCQRGDWMLWYVFKNRKELGLKDMRLITLAKALTVNLIHPLLKDERSKKAVEIAVQFGRGKATGGQLVAAAYAASAAAYAADYAAAAADDARKNILSKSADICREVFKKAIQPTK